MKLLPTSWKINVNVIDFFWYAIELDNIILILSRKDIDTFYLNIKILEQKYGKNII